MVGQVVTGGQVGAGGHVVVDGMVVTGGHVGVDGHVVVVGLLLQFVNPNLDFLSFFARENIINKKRSLNSKLNVLKFNNCYIYF